MPKFKLKIMQGFTLIEMAIVLIILGLVLSALLMPIRAQRDLQAQRQTEETLARAKQALIGYAQTFGRLPCPATLATNANEVPIGGGTCALTSGWLPAATLGIQPTNVDGYAIDGWDNVIRYAVTQVNVGGVATPEFTTPGEISNIGLAALAPNLRVCRIGIGVIADACSVGLPETNFLSNNAVAVIFSTGPTGLLGTLGVDETENLTGDRVFVSHGITQAGSPGGEFDHIVIWISPFELYNGMIAAGQLH